MLREAIPSITVALLPHFLVSSRTLISCCSMLIVPQTHRSLGRPQTAQMAAMDLTTYLQAGRANAPCPCWIGFNVEKYGRVDHGVERIYVFRRFDHGSVDQLATIIVCNCI